MKKYLIFYSILLFIGIFLVFNIVEARSGCCSWHGGVCGCGCCDGTPLSSTCAPYYPGCSGAYSPSYPSYPSYTPAPSYPATPDCPPHSTYSYLSDSCKCNSGYTANSSGTGCISMETYCDNLYGWHSKYNSLYDKCECNYGYVMWYDILKNLKCIDGGTYCRDLYGYNSSYNNISKECECGYGYHFDGDECKRDVSSSYSGIDYDPILKYFESQNTGTCPVNSYKNTDGKCYCNTGFKANKNKDGCIKILCSANSILRGNECVCNSGYVMDGVACVTPTELCKKNYGPNAYGAIENEKTQCYCYTGYTWDNLNSKCIKEVVVRGIDSGGELNLKIKEFINKEKGLLINEDKILADKLSGKILLQVEDRGEAWYVCPENKKRYYMANGDEAYNIMRDLGVGITDVDLDKVKTDKTFAKKHSGKIFLQVEDLGQAYYLDFEGEAHYLKDGQAAYTIMRELGLGIANNNIRKIDIILN